MTVADKVVVDSNLAAVLARLEVGAAGVDDAIEEELGEMAVGFFEDLTGFGAKREGGKVRRQLAFPGNGIWPVGERFRPLKSDYYVRHDRAGNRDLPAKSRPIVESGRSINAWRMDLKGATLRLINNARTNKRRHYSRFVHKVGDPVGQALKDAEAAFESRASDASKAIGKSVAKLIGGGNG